MRPEQFKKILEKANIAPGKETRTIMLNNGSMLMGRLESVDPMHGEYIIFSVGHVEPPKLQGASPSVAYDPCMIYTSYITLIY